MTKIGVVLVTYNRIEKLKKALKSYEDQIKKPEYIIIINNASTDQTKFFLQDWEGQNAQYKKYVINLPQNTGGSGGFYVGLEMAMNLDSDWVWVGDDDAYADKSAFILLEKYIASFKSEPISAICGKVIEQKKIARSHRKNIYQKKFRIIEDRLENVDYNEPFEINAFTYVGTAISIEKMTKIGLPKKEYFIWYDDAEHSMRLSKVGKIICLPDITVIHDNDFSLSNDNKIDWKIYYGIRNSYDFYTMYFSPFVVNLQFLYKTIRALLSGIKHCNFNLFEMYIHAIYDARNKRFGKSKIYFPGMK